jgi:hypothetical protein
VEDESLFGVPTSNEEASENLLKFELSLFRWIVIPEDDLKDPLAWWKKHECQSTCGLFGTTNFWNPKKLDWN